MSTSHYPFEHAKKPLLDLKSFRQRQMIFFLYAVLLIVICLGIGMIGYRYIADLDWMDSFYNASMILAGMGPADELHTNGAKLFAGWYAIFSGVIFLGTIAVMFAPMVHRFLHQLHVEK
jgi:hypothetical protein